MRIVFAGTSEFAVPSLVGLLGAGYDIVAVYTKPDRPSGRGQKITPNPIKKCASEHRLPVFQPQNLRNEESLLKRLDPELIVVTSYGVILPNEVLYLPASGCVNIHASLLPRWRGAAPIHRAIEAGDSHTGVTLMQMNDGLDTGDILFQTSVPINNNETTGTLYLRLSKIGAELLITRLPEITSRSAKITKQKELNATYAAKISHSERWLNWKSPAIELVRKIRAFNPRPLAKAILGDQVILVHEASYSPSDEDALAGTITKIGKGLIRVQTGYGCLDLNYVQLPGGRSLSTIEFLNGFRMTPGERFQMQNHA